ncbi:hypothetical protein AeNC1_000130 [Aphanomyces euteiches]|nr:hypothetical protein AeNC1_000130 [Aphanomyces euteiches]
MARSHRSVNLERAACLSHCEMSHPRLVVTRQPAVEFYKDEGGRSNYLTVQLAAQWGSREPPPPPRPLPLRVTLLYESGNVVEEQAIFRVVGDAPHALLLRDNSATIYFRLEKVSRRKDGQRFKLRIEVEPSNGVDLAPAFTTPICVLSKRKHSSDASKMDTPKSGKTSKEAFDSDRHEDDLAKQIHALQLQLTRLTALVESQHSLLTQLVHDKQKTADLDTLLKDENASFVSALGRMESHRSAVVDALLKPVETTAYFGADFY